jgi:hypothetical protein
LVLHTSLCSAGFSNALEKFFLRQDFLIVLRRPGSADGGPRLFLVVGLFLGHFDSLHVRRCEVRLSDVDSSQDQFELFKKKDQRLDFFSEDDA